ncbi:hypothetical protein Tco_0719354 [Tanacetum coccineum]
MCRREPGHILLVSRRQEYPAFFAFSKTALASVGLLRLGPEIIAHSSGMILLLRSVTVPPVTRNFNIPWAVDGIALILLTPGLPIIPLYGECVLQSMSSSCGSLSIPRALF